jgi:ligand-binding sensor domain-containing protein/signal transduction histidine kinase
MKKRFTAIVFAAMTVLNSTAALLPDAKFRSLDTRDGLSNSQVNCVLRDSRGFVWIGTSYGLNRYDGYHFKTFYANQRDTTSIRDNFVSQIFEAYDGKLWLQLGMNYCIYDPVTESFDRNVQKELEKFGIYGGIERLYIDQRKNFWVKPYEDGFYYYNPHTKKLHKFPLGYGPQEIHPEWGVSTMTDQGTSMVYATFTGELVCLDGEKGHISWKNSWIKRHGGSDYQEYRVRVDRKGNIYAVNLITTYIYHQKTKRWFKGLPTMLRANGIDTSTIPDGVQVWDVHVDRNARLWVATDHEGLYAIDFRGRQMRQFLHDKYDPTTINDNTPKNLYEDPDGQMWIGTYKNGVNQYRSGSAYARCAELGDINAVVEDRYGHFWIGTNDRGIIVYDADNNEQLQHYTSSNSGLAGNIMVGGTYASDGSIWFGSYNGGLTRCIPTGNKAGGEAVLVNYQATGKDGELANNSVWSVTEDKWHRIWVGLLGGGIQMLDLKTGKFRTWDTSNTKLPSNYITSAAWIKKGWLMMGTSYYYCLVNPVSGRLITQVFPGYETLSNQSGNTVCVMEDSRGLIWQGSVSGVIVYDPKTQKIQTLDMTNGLFASSVCSIAEDLSHVMWVVTDHGVSRIIPQQTEEGGEWQFIIRSFNQRDGLQQGTYNQRSTWLTRDGRLLIGGQGGLDIITPRNIGAGTSKERPIFSSLQVNDQEVNVGHKVDGRVILTKALSKCSLLKLKNDENNFTIELGSDAGLINNDKRFVYKLEGFREQWHKTAENNPNISFMSLHHGDYTLRVRMLNDDGTMSEYETTLDISIAPPLWRTRWALLLYVILLGVGAWWWRKRFLFRQSERLRIEHLRRETDKTQWMHEMQSKMMQEKQDLQEANGKAAAATADSDTVDAGVHYADSNANDQNSHADNGRRVQTTDFNSQPVMQEGDLVAFTRRFCQEYRMPADKSIRLSFLSLVETLPLVFDPKLLERALRILVDNSVNFSPSDGRIKVMIDQLNDSAELRVSDNGYGIPEDAKPYMFVPPVANDDTIGLYIVKNIVDAHKGTIRVTDNTPHGTVFFINLPLSNGVSPQNTADDSPIEEAVVLE